MFARLLPALLSGLATRWLPGRWVQPPAVLAVLAPAGCRTPGLTTGYRSRYPALLGLMMSPAWDSLALSGQGVRVGVIDEGFNGLRANPRT